MEIPAELIMTDYQQPLRAVFGERFQENALLARYTAARVGGPADYLMVVESAADLETATCYLWDLEIPFLILGGGSNVLVSDAGVRGVVLINRARKMRFDTQSKAPRVLAESGSNLGMVARQAANRGLAGLEWASGIPGTVGGAVVGNAGAHGGDMAGSLLVAEILHREKRNQYHHEQWTVDQLDYSYRSSVIKRQNMDAVVLDARLKLAPSTKEAVLYKMESFLEQRRKTQPPGASMGSMFKNPPGDYAGRLIDAAGLKGSRIGGAQISSLHANFFINTGGATAADIYQLLQVAHDRVASRFSVNLELEIELVGEWQNLAGAGI